MYKVSIEGIQENFVFTPVGNPLQTPDSFPSARIISKISEQDQDRVKIICLDSGGNDTPSFRDDGYLFSELQDPTGTPFVSALLAYQWFLDNTGKNRGGSGTGQTAPQVQAAIDASILSKKSLITGIVDGGILSANANTLLFDISDGSGYVVDSFTDPLNPVITTVSWTGLTALTPAHSNVGVTFVAINSVGAVVQQSLNFTKQQRRELIILGDVVSNDQVNVTGVTCLSDLSSSDYTAIDLFSYVGAMNLSGNNYTAASTDLTIRKESGKTAEYNINKTTNAKSPHELVSALQSPATFIYLYSDGSGGFTIQFGETDIAPDLFDDGSGTLATVSNNKFTNQIIYFFPATNTTLVQYGEIEFDNLADAKEAAKASEHTILQPDITNEHVRTILSVKKETTDLSDTGEAVFSDTGKFGLTGGLSGGGTSDDQTAAEVTYDNATSGLTATDVKGAIDELAANTDADIPEWVASTVYAAGTEFTFTTSSTTAVDSNGDEVIANKKLIGAYLVGKTSSATLTDIEIALTELRSPSISEESIQESIDLSIQEIEDKKIFSNDARSILKQRFEDGYITGAGFSNDIADAIADAATFTGNPSQFRPTFGGVQNIPSAGQSLHTSAFYAYSIEDIALSNVVATEILGTVNANDLNTTYWNNSGTLRWDTDNDLWIQVSKMKKIKDSYYYIKKIQNVLTQAEKDQIMTWFARFVELAYPPVSTRFNTYLGVGWENTGLSIFNPEGAYPGGIENPIQDGGGADLYTMTWSQDTFNNRNWDLVAGIHSWAVQNNDIEKERWAREFFKVGLKYGLFSDGTWWEMVRNTDADPTLGVFYGWISIGAMVQIAHLDASYNHFPNDRLYDYKTTDGILNGSTNITTGAYFGTSTTDGVTEKSLYSFLVGQSNYLRSEANGGWNDVRFFENSTPTLIPLSTENTREPSVIPAIANLYYKDQRLKDLYLYDTNLGYPAKVIISEGYLAGVGNEDNGPWGNMIMGSAWMELENSFFEYRGFISEEKSSVNVFNSETITSGFLSPNNFPNASGTYNYSYFIKVIPGLRYTGSHSMRFTTHFDINKNNVTGGSSSTINFFTAPVGVHYVRISINVTDTAAFQLEQNSVSTEYESFDVIQLVTTAGTTANRPVFPPIGTPRFDTDLGYNINFNGTVWVDGSGVTV